MVSKSSEKARKQALSGYSCPDSACFYCINLSVYGDDGFSGTNTEHRQGFQKLMKDAMDGKIDMIITKAVSRFARNLMDCIICTANLKLILYKNVHELFTR